MNYRIAALAALLVVAASGAANAQMRITEWMYSGSGAEFIEFTNVGATSIDLTGWSYDDDSAAAGAFVLSPLGVVAPGESVVITEDTEASFRAAWSLPASVKVLAEYTNNLGRNDQVNLFDSSNSFVDRLTYGDQNLPGTIRAQGASGNPSSPAALGVDNVALWQLSFIGDGFGTYASSNGDLGNPGTYVVPEPSTVLLLAFGAVALVARRTRKFVQDRHTA